MSHNHNTLPTSSTGEGGEHADDMYHPPTLHRVAEYDPRRKSLTKGLVAFGALAVAGGSFLLGVNHYSDNAEAKTPPVAEASDWPASEAPETVEPSPEVELSFEEKVENARIRIDKDSSVEDMGEAITAKLEEWVNAGATPANNEAFWAASDAEKFVFDLATENVAVYREAFAGNQITGQALVDDMFRNNVHTLFTYFKTAPGYDAKDIEPYKASLSLVSMGSDTHPWNMGVITMKVDTNQEKNRGKFFEDGDADRIDDGNVVSYTLMLGFENKEGKGYPYLADDTYALHFLSGAPVEAPVM